MLVRFFTDQADAGSIRAANATVDHGFSFRATFLCKNEYDALPHVTAYEAPCESTTAVTFTGGVAAAAEQQYIVDLTGDRYHSNLSCQYTFIADADAATPSATDAGGTGGDAALPTSTSCTRVLAVDFSTFSLEEGGDYIVFYDQEVTFDTPPATDKIIGVYTGTDAWRAPPHIRSTGRSLFAVVRTNNNVDGRSHGGSADTDDRHSTSLLTGVKFTVTPVCAEVRLLTFGVTCCRLVVVLLSAVLLFCCLVVLLSWCLVVLLSCCHFSVYNNKQLTSNTHGFAIHRRLHRRRRRRVRSISAELNCASSASPTTSPLRAPVAVAPAVTAVAVSRCHFRRICESFCTVRWRCQQSCPSRLYVPHLFERTKKRLFSPLRLSLHRWFFDRLSESMETERCPSM
jgi:hypothetical protein